MKKEYILNNLVDTEQTAIELVASLQGGEWIALNGPLGAGKTTFTQATARSFGVFDLVRSPTYSLVHTYKTNHPTIKTLVHADLYRLESVDASDIGLDEWVGKKDVVVFVEWPERLREGRFDVELKFLLEEWGRKLIVEKK